jgi:hypothetical protein
VVLRELKWRLKRITDGNRDTLKNNHEVARRRSLLLLYARSVCFRVFLECAAAMTGGITENHKVRWLLIQVAPATLLKQPDIFLACTRSAGSPSTGYLEGALADELSLIKKYLPQSSTLFCVLDEAQVLTKNSDYFRSETSPQQDRPILREILRSWREKLPDLIVSGTGISMREVETAMGAVVAKEGGGGPPTVTEIGGFDDEDGRRAYLEQYFPPGFLDTPEGKEVVSRVGYWLRGRFVFHAAV